ncbi:unnamed protein product [Discosporangium mesarthrocarpum]
MPSTVGLNIETSTCVRKGMFPLAVDHILSLPFSFSNGVTLVRFTVGSNQEPEKVKGAEAAKLEDSTSLVDWAIIQLLLYRPDFLCLHSGYNFDIPVMMGHASENVSKYFCCVPLGASDTVCTINIDGITAIDTSLLEYNIHDALLRRTIAEKIRCVEEVCNLLCNCGRSPMFDVSRYITGSMITMSLVSFHKRYDRL